jgi:signal transduction histidine kinase
MVNEKTKDLILKNQEILNKNEEISMQAESLENLNLTKDKIFSIISHDLRGPINQVQQMLNLLEYTYITEGDFKSVLPDLKESVRYTVSLTDNLLHWARNQMEGVKVKPSVFDIHEVIEENFRLFRPLAVRKSVTLTNTFEDHFQVFADKDMIKLVIRNLVNNAIKFTDANGSIEMGARIQSNYITVYIRDTGKGIRNEDISKILSKETFTTTGTQGERGVGLGLSLCQEFIEKNAGQLYIESELNKGSKFSFTIPTSAEHLPL